MSQSIVQIHPNPAQSLLRVAYPVGKEDGYMRIFDMQGRLHRQIRLTGSTGITEMPVWDMPNGLYVAYWYFNGLTGQSKIVISH